MGSRVRSTKKPRGGSQMTCFYTLFGDTGRSRIGVGSRGKSPRRFPGVVTLFRAEPPEFQGFWAINNCQMSMLLCLSCDTGRSRIGVGSRGGAPGNLAVWGNKLLSDEHAFYTLFGDNGRSRIGVGSRGGAPGSSGVLGNKLSDEHAFIPYLVTLVGRELVWGPGGRAPGSSGVLGLKNIVR